jgi:hypothetical protein
MRWPKLCVVGAYEALYPFPHGRNLKESSSSVSLALVDSLEDAIGRHTDDFFLSGQA